VLVKEFTMTNDTGTPRTMIEILQQERLDALETQAMLDANDDTGEELEVRGQIVAKLGQDTMDKIDIWREIALFETNVSQVANLLYERSTGDCSVGDDVLYDMCSDHIDRLMMLLVAMGVVVITDEA